MLRAIDCVQGSPAWWAARAGRPTASEFGRIITPKTGKLAAGRVSYQAELIAESLGWRKEEFAGSPDIERGRIMEAEARRWAALELGEEISQVGFLVSECERYGASPDGIIIDDVVGTVTPVELKCPDLHTIIKWHMAEELPPDHKAQVHGQMVVTGADRAWFIAYADHSEVENILIEVVRDDFTEALAECLDTFCNELEEWKGKIVQC